MRRVAAASYSVVAEHDDDRTGEEPECIEPEEGIVESSLLWVVFQCEASGVEKDDPAHHPQYHQAVA